MLSKLILAGVLLALTAAPCAAQFPKDTYGGGGTKSDATFSLCDRCINHRHKASLGGGNSVTVELLRHSGYSLIPDAEALLAGVSRDISFLADSIRECPQCSYRVDYVVAANGMKSYRLRRYMPQGTFLYQKGSEELKPFKAEPDTLHLLIRGARNGEVFDEACQLTFILNRIANLDTLLAQRGRLNHAIDTMRQRSAPRTHSLAGSGAYRYKTTVSLFRNYRDTSKSILYFRRGVGITESPDFASHTAFDVQLNFGAGFLRDRLAPIAEGGVVYRLPSTRGDDIGELLIGLYGSGYFAFARGDDGHYNIQDNWFLNAEFGGESSDDNIWATKISRTTLAVGYLISGKGDYFRGTTMKLSLNVRLKNGFTLSPEIIATDGLRQVFPGLTLKVF